MWVVRGREGIHVQLKSIFTLGLLGLLQAVFVALEKQLLDFFFWFAVELHGECSGFETLVPDGVEFFFRARPGSVFSVELDEFLFAEVQLVEAGFYFVHQILQPIHQAGLVAVEDVECRLKVTFSEGVIQRVAILLHVRNIGRQEVHSLVI